MPVLDGATALYPLYSAFVQAVYPNKNYKSRHSKAMCNNTMTAYQSFVESIKNQTYPLTSDFYAVTLSDNTNPNVVKFLEWILSPQGQALVEKTGYCAIY